MTSAFRSRLAAFTLALFAATAASAQAATLDGDPIRVASAATTPATTRSAAGEIINAWRSTASDGAILAQRLAVDGSPIGMPFAVSESTSRAAADPQVASDAAGSFVIVWTEQNPLSPRNRRVQARRYGADGSAAGAAFTVEAGADQADVAMASAGDFVIATARNTPLSRLPGLGLGYSAEISVHRYHADGRRAGLAVTVDRITDTGNGGLRPQRKLDLDGLSANADGGFTVAWQRTAYQLNVSTALSAVTVLAQRYAASGKPATAAVEVTAFSTDRFSVFDDKTFHHRAALASDASGAFGLCWENGIPFGPDRAGPIQARVWEADGRPRFDAVQVSADPAEAIDHSCALTMSAGGGLVIGWHSDRLGGTQLRSLARDGTALGGVLTLTQPVVGASGRPDFGIDAADRPVVVDSLDGPVPSVRAQRLLAP